MSLPSVRGWIIDFRTARQVFASGNNQRIDHCVAACASGIMKHCHAEHELFKGVAALKAPFVDDNNCQCVPDAAILERCVAIAGSPPAQRLIKGGNSAIFITATAVVQGFGVISSHHNLVFRTVRDLCSHFGVPVVTADEYFNEVL